MKIDEVQNERARAAFQADPDQEVTVHLWGLDDQEVSYPGYIPARVPARHPLEGPAIRFPRSGEMGGVVVAKGVEIRGNGEVLRVEFRCAIGISTGVEVRADIRCWDEPEPLEFIDATTEMMMRRDRELDAANEEIERLRDELAAVQSRIDRAIEHAGNRWGEWGDRALGVVAILEGVEEPA
jgi:hypothetical protein